MYRFLSSYDLSLHAKEKENRFIPRCEDASKVRATSASFCISSCSDVAMETSLVTPPFWRMTCMTFVDPECFIRAARSL